MTDKVIEGSFRVLGESIRALTAAEQWSDLQLDQDAQTRFAERAHVLRFGFEDVATHPIAPVKLLASRRYEDKANDLWTVFNRVQENAMQGGLHGHMRSNGRVRNVKTREIHGIDQSIKFNVNLWQLGETTAHELAA